MNQRLTSCRRLVLKIGSSLLVDSDGALREDWLRSLCTNLVALRSNGADIVVVCSGAIALGREPLGLKPQAGRLAELQAAAAIGQVRLAQAWVDAMAPHDQRVAQLLLTLQDTESRQRYLNALDTLNTLLVHKVVPVVNENDSVATDEIRYGDNDRLAARVAQMLDADCLVLLSNIDGLFDRDPESPAAQLISQVDRVTPEIEAMAGIRKSAFGSGGMPSKIEAARIATNAGCEVFVTNGLSDQALALFLEGGPATHFKAQSRGGAARKRWIAASLKPVATVVIDAGAAAALNAGNSLLAVGLLRTDGSFERGDLLQIQSPDGIEIGRGLSACDSTSALGDHKSKDDLRGRLLVHRNDLVMSDG